MEQEIQSRVLTLPEKTKGLMEEETGISTSVDEDDVKRYLHRIREIGITSRQ